jgi:hypothetical protein
VKQRRIGSANAATPAANRVYVVRLRIQTIQVGQIVAQQSSLNMITSSPTTAMIVHHKAIANAVRVYVLV